MPAASTLETTQELREHTPRRDIQGLRAIAVIVVVAYHAGLPLPGGFVGVDVFFVISGFVITGMLMRELTTSGTIRMRRFYGRRVKRLIPALALVLLVTLALTFLLGSPFDGQQQTTAATAVGAILMFANGVIFLRSGDYFATPPTNNPLLNTWSLSVEEQFYLVFPTLLLVLWWWSRKRGWGRTVLTLGLVVGTAASFALSVSMSFGVVSGPLTDPEWFAFYASPTRAWEFGVGALVYLLFAEGTRSWGTRTTTSAWWIGMAGIAASCFVITEASVFPGWIAVLPVVSTALVLAAGSRSPEGMGLLTSRPMVAVGDASYSWYLWHWPLIAFSVMLLPSLTWAPLAAGALSLGLAALTLRFVENPVRFARLSGRAIVALAAGSVAAVVAVSLALIFGARVGWFNPSIQQMMAQVTASHRWLDDCNSAQPLGERGPNCQWNVEGTGKTIFLVGDSMAGALGEGLTLAAVDTDRPIEVGTRGACPFIDATLYVDGRSDEDCDAVVQGSLAWLETQPPSDVVISSTLGYLVIDGVGLGSPGSDAPRYDEAGKRDVYLDGLRSAVGQLTDAGHRVTVVLPPPGFPRTVMAYEAWRPSQCATYEALMNIASCGEKRSEVEVEQETAELFTEVERAVLEGGGSIWNPRGDLCSEGVCATNVGDEWRYLDGSHLSVTMSEALAPQWSSRLAAQR